MPCNRRLWNRAKAEAKKSAKSKNFYALATHIYEKMRESKSRGNRAEERVSKAWWGDPEGHREARLRALVAHFHLQRAVGHAATALRQSEESARAAAALSRDEAIRAKKHLESSRLKHSSIPTLHAAINHLEGGRHKLAYVALRSAAGELGRDIGRLPIGRNIPPAVEAAQAGRFHFRYVASIPHTKSSASKGTVSGNTHIIHAPHLSDERNKQELEDVKRSLRRRGFSIRSEESDGHGHIISYEHPKHGVGEVYIVRKRPSESSEAEGS